MSKRPSPRPRFELRSDLPPAEIAKRVRAFLETSKRVRGLALPVRLELSIQGDEQHFWSPQLCADVSEGEDGGSKLDARFSPDPYVWAMYLLAYVAVVTATLITLVFGLAQLSLGQQPIALYCVPGGVVLAGLVYGASFVGQGLGSEQMYFLRHTLTELIEAEEPE